MQLELVVGDFHLDPAELAVATTTAGLPRLPGFEAALQCGRLAHRSADWRAFLAQRAGRPELLGLPPAQVAAAALNLPADANPWFAQPVHLAAGMDHLRLHRSGLLSLSPEELDGLVSGFSTAFQGTGLALRPLFGGLLLTGLAARDAVTRDPALFLGADMGGAPASGPQSAELRRVGAEIEMWLHGQAFNTVREKRGQLSVNALWLWGGGPERPAAGDLRQLSACLPRVYADDAYVAGLWHASGGETQSVPADLAALLADPEWQGSQALVVLSAAARSARDAPLQRLDASWLLPAMQALRSGQLSRLSVQCGGLQVSVTGLSRWRFWRRARPWWAAYA